LSGEHGAPRTPEELRILVLAPTSNDARLTARFLESAGLAAAVCADLDALDAQMKQGCGALLLAEESLVNGGVTKLVAALETQPSWSDLPLVLITASGEVARSRLHHLSALGVVGNISIIERPVRPETLVSTCEVALRSRRRQYQVRDLLRELKEMMAQIQQQSRIFDTTLSSIPDFMYILDRSRRFIYANRSLLELLGLDLKGVVGKRMSELPFPDHLASRLDQQIQQVFESGEIVRDEMAYTNAAGVTGYYEYIFTPVVGADDTVEVVAASTRDTSQRRQSEEALREADRRKDEFLAMLAHELRNPLAAVANATALLDSESPQDRNWAVGVIRRQNAQLTHLIEDLLDVSRINTGKIILRKRKLDVAEILDRARDSALPLIQERGHVVTREYESNKLWIEADATRVEQIVLNLLTNAAKYTPPGGRIQFAAQQQDGEVVITVRDNGIGIAAHLLPEMFKLFTQGERSIDRSEGGLGIGLTIVQRLVEMHGGRIEARSDGPNLGSTFMVHFPAVAAPEEGRTEAAPNHAGEMRRVLIVDDNVDTAVGMARLLTRAGHKIELAHDGIEAIEKARRQCPEAVVLDIGLPGMDGFAVARELRRETGCAGVTIIAVTGYGQPDDRKRALDAGCHYHLVKPVDIDELKRILEEPASS
jgi:PAS domain S-box-containing protein